MGAVLPLKYPRHGRSRRPRLTPSLSPVTLQTSAGGVFELKLRSFENKFGLDEMDTCCSGGKTSRGVCVNQCATKFRVCLMHYQRVIDEHPACTFGETTTPVLGQNTFKIQSGGNGTFVNPIVFPFSFSWPVSTQLGGSRRCAGDSPWNVARDITLAEWIAISGCSVFLSCYPAGGGSGPSFPGCVWRRLSSAIDRAAFSRPPVPLWRPQCACPGEVPRSQRRAFPAAGQQRRQAGRQAGRPIYHPSRPVLHTRAPGLR